MPDFLTKKQRSELMSRIRSKNTKPELEMARLLDEGGIKYERHKGGLPGKPDFFFPSSRLALFVNGTFWHGKDFEKWKGKLKPYWLAKISGNIRRDKRTDAKLRRMGHSVMHVWENDVWKMGEKCMGRIRKRISEKAK